MTLIGLNSWLIPVKAQQLGEWVSLKLKVDLPHGLSGVLTQDVRTVHPGLQINQLLTDFELGYKINKRLDIAVNYRYSRKREDHHYLYPRNRWYFDFKYDNKLNRLDTDYRVRFQRQTKTYIEDADDKIPVYYLRNRIKIAYNLPNNKKEPYVTYEIYCPVNKTEPRFLDAHRITAGIDIPINKKNEIDVGLMYKREYLPVYASFINLLLTYSFDLN
ncbi:MAG: DUF2490 domain-containing protein [Bacteroidota bacterium]